MVLRCVTVRLDIRIVRVRLAPGDETSSEIQTRRHVSEAAKSRKKRFYKKGEVEVSRSPLYNLLYFPQRNFPDSECDLIRSSRKRVFSPNRTLEFSI